MRAALVHVVVHLLAGVATVLVAGQSAFGARLLKATIEVNGQPVLETAYSDRGTESPETVWRYLGSEPGWVETAKIEPDPKNLQRARLEGEIVIRVTHGGQQVVEGRATKLELIRFGSPNDRWFLPESEVERLAAANGIAQPAQGASLNGPVWLWLIGGLAAIVVAVGLLAWIAWPRGRTGVRQPSE
jgi:hypothetical protein